MDMRQWSHLSLSSSIGKARLAKSMNHDPMEVLNISRLKLEQVQCNQEKREEPFLNLGRPLVCSQDTLALLRKGDQCASAHLYQQEERGRLEVRLRLAGAGPQAKSCDGAQVISLSPTAGSRKSEVNMRGTGQTSDHQLPCPQCTDGSSTLQVCPA